MRLTEFIEAVARTLLLLSVDSIAIVWGKFRYTGTYTGYVAFVRVDAIGDFIVWLRSAQMLRQQYASRKTVLVANATWAAFARDMGIWSAVMPVDVGKFLTDMVYRFSIISRLSAAGCAIAINSTHSRSIYVDDALARGARARVRIASAGDSANVKRWQKALSDRIYNRLIPGANPEEAELVRHFQFTRGLGIESAEIEIVNLAGYAASLCNPYADGAPYYVLAPGAGWAGRRWPVEGYAAIAEHLEGRYGLVGVIVGSAADNDLADRIIGEAGATVRSAVGRTDLAGLLGVIRDARLVVCNDTSAVHIAAALGVPCVCILGGGQFGRFAPYRSEWKCAGVLPVTVHRQMDCFGCNWHCMYDVADEAAVPCVRYIDVNDVKTAVDDVLGGRMEPLDRPALGASGDPAPRPRR